jgi:hypothetical protein
VFDPVKDKEQKVRRAACLSLLAQLIALVPLLLAFA